MLSLSCKAAIKAVTYIGSKFPSAEKISIREVAGFINENEHTVGKILQKLVRNNIINSTKGPNGGFYSTEEQTKRKIIDVIIAIDGEEVFTRCGLGLSKCSETHPCPVHIDYKPVKDSFKEMCERNRVCDLYKNLNNGLVYLTG